MENHTLRNIGDGLGAKWGAPVEWPLLFKGHGNVERAGTLLLYLFRFGCQHVTFDCCALTHGVLPGGFLLLLVMSDTPQFCNNDQI